MLSCVCVVSVLIWAPCGLKMEQFIHFCVIMFFRKASPQTEGSRHAHHRIKSSPESDAHVRDSTVPWFNVKYTAVVTELCKSTLLYCTCGTWHVSSHISSWARSWARIQLYAQHCAVPPHPRYPTPDPSRDTTVDTRSRSAHGQSQAVKRTRTSTRETRMETRHPSRSRPFPIVRRLPAQEFRLQLADAVGCII